MSNELFTNYPGDSATIYAVIRKQTTAYVWNGSAFVAWNDADIADYAVSLTSESGDLYRGDMPDVAVGGYFINYYVQAGGSPATTDLLITKGLYTWNGVSVTVYVGSVPLEPTALVSLETVKRYLNITVSTYDDRLIQFINQVSRMIQTYCDRVFMAQSLIERVDLNNQRVVNLKAWPIIAVNAVGWGLVNCMTSTYSGSALGVAMTTLPDRIKYVVIDSAGIATSYEYLYADYPTTTLLAAAISSGVPGVTAAVTGNVVPSRYMNPLAGVQLVGLNSFASTAPQFGDILYQVSNQEAGQLSILANPYDYAFGWNGNGNNGGYGSGWGNGAAGSYGINGYGPGQSLNIRFGTGRQALVVDYSGGYATIPQDVQFVACQLIQMAYQRSTINTMVESQKLGDASIKFNTMALNMPQFTPDQIAILGAYGNVVMGRMV